MEQSANDVAATMQQELDKLLCDKPTGTAAESSAVTANEWLAGLPKAPFVG